MCEEIGEENKNGRKRFELVVFNQIKGNFSLWELRLWAEVLEFEVSISHSWLSYIRVPS